MQRWRALSLAALFGWTLTGFAQSTVPVEGSLFSPSERSAIVTYWADPSRYVQAPPADFRQNGLWQIRLTPQGSLWLWNYNRARHVSAPPTANAQPANDQQRVWEDWLLVKLKHDRWEAWQNALAANRSVLSIEAPRQPKDLDSASEPPQPGPEPPDMQAAVGDPPILAWAVVPTQYTVKFDDLTISYSDHVLLGNPRYAYYRFTNGVDSEGIAVSTLPSDRMDRIFQLAGCSDSEARVMRAVSPLEGGFDAINTYDTGYVSVGFIQFASLQAGNGSLGEMLADYKKNDPTDFQNDLRKYGIDVAPNNDLDVVDPETGAEVYGSDANTRIIADKRLIAVFQRAGQLSDAFCAEQVRSAKSQFYPKDDPVTVTAADGTAMTGKVSDFIKSEAGMATLFDRKVNTGKLAALAKAAGDVAAAHGCKSLADLVQYEREIVTGLKYRKDFLKDSTLSQPP